MTGPAATGPAAAGADGSDQHAARLRTVDRLRGRGVEPYPVGFQPAASISEVRARAGDLAPDSRTGIVTSIAGRVMLNRVTGALVFATVRDATGDLQVMLTADTTGAAALAEWKSDVDLGDLVGITGTIVTTRRGELSVLVSEWLITAKALHPLPEKYRGLTDPEARIRARYLDLLLRPEARMMVRARADVLASLRRNLDVRGFCEVETPMLQVMPGGANARPFITHSNAYDLPLYLRIAPELYLKRLLVGGLERVYEINRNFRNEGADSRHNPEFTMLEMYEAHGDYHSMADLTRMLILDCAQTLHDAPIARHDDAEHDLSGPWPWVTVWQGLSERLGEVITPDTPVATLRTHAQRLDIALDPSWSAGTVILELYEHLLEATTVSPTFYADFPADVSPLTRGHRSLAGAAERWDLVAFGAEIATGYTELNDPAEQRRRLEAQAQRGRAGDDEAMRVDEDFLRALEHAMPPAGGQGMGVDRLLMMLTGRGIRETVLFPLVRPLPGG